MRFAELPEWSIAERHPHLTEHAERLSLHEIATQVLLNRGGSGDASTAHLDPQLAHLHDPSGLSDMDRAVVLLADAIAAREPICVYGDYDVDGTTSTALMIENLRLLGAVCGFYLPHRLLQGYGLHNEAVDEIAAQSYKVLVTCDLGISNASEVAYARSLGLRVIVVDHHQVPAQFPEAEAVINPHRVGDQFPYKPMCAAGVCFHLLIALRRYLRARGDAAALALDLRRSLDLVALATVADMVPLTGTNRVLVSRGLEVLRQSRRPGLAALAKVAGVDPERIDAQALGFRLGPRINAAGRMGSAMRCVELLLADGLMALDYASRLDQENVHRREVEERVLVQAVQQAEHMVGVSDPPGLVLYGPEWHPGVIGIVASRIVERFARPVVICGQGGKGSARSVPTVNVLTAIRACAEHLVKFGGHPAAAGVTVRAGSMEAFQLAFAEAVRAQAGDRAYRHTLRIDMRVEAASLDQRLVQDLARVGPFGMGHEEPLLMLTAARITGRRVVGQGHLKLGVAGGLSAIGFRLADHPDANEDVLDLAFVPVVSEWQGKSRIELQLKAMRAAAPA
jgi:single-stranded-DNA-specific exonuclease